MVEKEPHATTVVTVPKKAPPKSISRPRKALPGPEDCGAVLSMKTWKIQCSNDDVAMLCRKSDPTDRRCASKRAGKFRWTYGSFCDRHLPCYKKACP